MHEQPQLETPFRQKLEAGSFPNKPDDSRKVKRTNPIICPVLPYYIREFICWRGTGHLLMKVITRDLPSAMVGWGCSISHGSQHQGPAVGHGGMGQSSCPATHVAHSYPGIEAKGISALLTLPGWGDLPNNWSPSPCKSLQQPPVTPTKPSKTGVSQRSQDPTVTARGECSEAKVPPKM